MTVPILLGKKLKVRIFRPSEVIDIRSMMKISDRTAFDMCLLLGARYEECRRIQTHPEWFDGNFVRIEEHKTKRVSPRRAIRLSNRGKNLIEYFFDLDKPLPCVQGWNEKLQRWARLSGIDDIGVTARSLRKTYESWLIMSFPHVSHAPMVIYESQGHTDITSFKHYTNTSFTTEEIAEMKEWTDGYL
jgi:integrase